MNRYRFIAVEASTGNKVGGIVEAVNVSGAIRLIKDHDLYPSKVEVITAPDDDLSSVAGGQQAGSNGRLLHVAPIENPDGTSNTSLLTWLGAWAVAIFCVAAFLFAVGLALYLPYWIVQDIKDGHVYSGGGTVNSPIAGGGVRINRTSSPILFWFNISWRTVGAVAMWACLIWCLRRIFFSSAKPKHTVTKSSEKSSRLSP